jgi:hypothetical protein
MEAAHIFNGIFEIRNLAQNCKKNAKIRQKRTPRAAVYYTYIKHTGALGQTNASVTHSLTNNRFLVEMPL